MSEVLEFRQVGRLFMSGIKVHVEDKEHIKAVFTWNDDRNLQEVVYLVGDRWVGDDECVQWLEGG
jgi:hypothetical protein